MSKYARPTHPARKAVAVADMRVAGPVDVTMRPAGRLVEARGSV